MPPASSWTLKGSFTTTLVAYHNPSSILTHHVHRSVPRPSRAIHLTFEIGSHTFSALKIDQLRVSGETYKPFKGVRGRSTADIEWRW